MSRRRAVHHRARPIRRVVGAALAAFLLAACSSGDDAGLVLDGSVFEADDAGIVDAVSAESITIDGETRPLADEIVVFSAGSLARVDLAPRLGQYVQVGVEDGEVVWVASIGGVVPLDPPVVLFEGTPAVGDANTVTFTTGLRLAVRPEVGVLFDPLVVVRIDPTTDEIVGMQR